MSLNDPQQPSGDFAKGASGVEANRYKLDGGLGFDPGLFLSPPVTAQQTAVYVKTIQSGGTKIGNGEPILDFEPNGASRWNIVDDPTNNRVKVQGPLILTGTVPATGTTPSGGTGFTYTHTNGTGIYVFTSSTNLGLRVWNVKATVTTLAARIPIITATSGTGFTIEILNSSTGAAVDASFSFQAIAEV